MIRLCSTSKTRAKLLENFNIDFIQSPIDFNEESIKTEDAKSFVYSVVKGKLNNAKELYKLDIPLLVADTVIESDGKILRKAKNIEEAKKLLLLQSGKKISIISAAILKSEHLEFIDISSTSYFFREFNKDDLEKYLKSNEWKGKAGACMVEGFCKKYIQNVNGLETTAMGLQVEKILPWFEF
jgi:septum formation protein